MLLSLSAVFFFSFLSATIFPFFSETVLVGSLMNPDNNRLALWTAATTGNTIGACINWYLGKFLTKFQNKSWFPANKKQMDRAEKFFSRYGKWSLLISWAPVFGDAITVVAGTLKLNLKIFILLVFIGKGFRYMAIINGTDLLLL